MAKEPENTIAGTLIALNCSKIDLKATLFLVVKVGRWDVA